MTEQPPSKLARRVAAAAETALSERKVVTPLDVLTGLGWLSPRVADAWRQGRVDTVEQEVAVGPDRLADALDLLARWARDKGLEPAEVEYVSATRDRRPLRFTTAGEAATERAFHTHWISPTLSRTAQERLVERQSAPPDLIVISPLGEWACAECGDTGPFLIMDAGTPLCLTCADMDHLVFLPAGNAALTRRAKKASTLSAVVVRFSRARKRYERQGLLIEPAALDDAERQCLSDADARQRRRERDRERREGLDAVLVSRMTEEIIRMYPGCPPARAGAIAAHTGLRGSGRVGRSAAGRALAPDAITRAVVASVRHEDTEYDRLLMSGAGRAQARERVRDRIDRVLSAWRG